VLRMLLPLGLALMLTGCGFKSTDDWIAQLKDRDAARRLHAVRALGQRHAEARQSVPALALALKDENAFVRRDAAMALGSFGSEATSAVPDLVAAERDRNGSVRRAAADALQKIDPAVAAKMGVRRK
jgi:HEAT repeat protein